MECTSFLEDVSQLKLVYMFQEYHIVNDEALAVNDIDTVSILYLILLLFIYVFSLCLQEITGVRDGAFLAYYQTRRLLSLFC